MLGRFRKASRLPVYAESSSVFWVLRKEAPPLSFPVEHCIVFPQRIRSLTYPFLNASALTPFRGSRRLLFPSTSSSHAPPAHPGRFPHAARPPSRARDLGLHFLTPIFLRGDFHPFRTFFPRQLRFLPVFANP